MAILIPARQQVTCGATFAKSYDPSVLEIPVTEKAGFARAHCLCCFVSTRSTAQRIFGPEWPEEPALSVSVLFGSKAVQRVAKLCTVVSKAHLFRQR